MNFGKVRIAYPYIEYDLEVTHHTERKSTAMEWILLEIARTVEKYPEYETVPLNDILKSLFSIADGDLLLRQVLLDLIDVDALKYIPGFNDRSNWDNLTCGDLKLTEVGRNLQAEGRLPAKTQKNSLTVIYDVINNRLVNNNKTLSDDTNNIKAKNIDADNLPAFPEVLVLNYVESLQQKTGSSPSWLQKNSRIDLIEPVTNEVKWENTLKEILADEKGNLSLKNETDSEVIERALHSVDFGELPDYNLPLLTVSDLLTRRKVQPYAKCIENISSAANKSEFFFLAPQFEEIIAGLNEKNYVVFGQSSFSIEQDGNKKIIRIPQDVEGGMCYQDSHGMISVGKVESHFGNITYNSAYVYEMNADFDQAIIELVEKYYLSEPQILCLLKFIKNPPYQKFYTEDFLRQKLSAPQIEALTPIDENLQQLLSFDKKIKDLLPTFTAQTNCDTVRRFFIKKGIDFLRDVHDLVNQWQKISDSVRRETSINLNELDLQGTLFGVLLEQMKQITKAISLFFDEASEEYSKIYVLDTSALRHYPALLDDFTNNRTMIIIPKDVLASLEELKKSENNKVKNDAEKALQKIAEFKYKRWLNLEEDSHEELLEETEREHRIFSIILKYLVKYPVLVTDENDLKNFAASKDIETITAHELHDKMNGNTVAKGKSKKKSKGKKK